MSLAPASLHVRGNNRIDGAYSARLWGSTEHWDYNDEFTFQWRWFASGDTRAWAVSTEHGYRMEQAPLRPRFGLRAVAFSGDQNPSSHNVGTFNSIFEKGPYFSYAELFARRNLVALQPSAELKLMKSVSLTFNPAFFWRGARVTVYTAWAIP